MPTLNQSWVAGEAILPLRIVSQDPASPRQMRLATLGHYPIGVTHGGTMFAPIPEVTTNNAVAAGDSCRVYGPDEECEVDVGAIAIVAGDRVAPDANSEAQPAVHGFPILGVALDDSAALGKVRVRILVPEIENKSNVALVKVANYTVLLGDLGKIFMNTAAGGAIEFDLPAAVVGYEVHAQVSAAEALRLDPNGNETIALPSTGVQGAVGKYLEADAIGERVHLKCQVAGTWSCISYNGTWTAEA